MCEEHGVWVIGVERSWCRGERPGVPLCRFLVQLTQGHPCYFWQCRLFPERIVEPSKVKLMLKWLYLDNVKRKQGEVQWRLKNPARNCETGTKAKVVGKKRRADGFENYLVERITDWMESRGRGRGRKEKGYSWCPWLGRSIVWGVIPLGGNIEEQVWGEEWVQCEEKSGCLCGSPSWEA